MELEPVIVHQLLDKHTAVPDALPPSLHEEGKRHPALEDNLEALWVVLHEKIRRRHKLIVCWPVKPGASSEELAGDSQDAPGGSPKLLRLVE